MHNDTGIFEVTVFPNDAEDVEYKVWVNDSVEPGISLSSSVVTIKMNIDHDDDVLPEAQLYTLNTIRDTAALAPLTNVSGAFINNTLGSLFISSVAPKVVQGHIETRSTSPYNNTGGADPDVSGEIILRGRAYDNQRISTISLEINGVTIPIIDANASGRLKVVTGQELRVMVADKIGLAGHEAEWSYIWNTASVDGVARDNVEVKVIVVDANSKVNTEVPYVDEAVSYDSTTYDVVPYITFITTPKRTNSGLKNDNIRSSSGKYSVITGTDGTFITVDGFNLNPAANSARIVSSSDVTGVVTTGSGIGINNSAGSGTYKQITVSNNSTRSGYLELFVNGIRTINNINNNDLDSNKEPNLTVKNTTLNDDRYLRFFNMKDTGIKNAYYPDMIMSNNNPVFGYVDLNGINSLSALTTYQNQCYQPQRAEFSALDGSLVNGIEYLIGGLSWDQMAMTRDDSGRYTHATVYNYSGARMSVIYNRYAEQHTWSNGWYTDGWGDGTQYNGYGGVVANQEDNNAIAIDSINNAPGALIGRYQNLKILAKGDSTTATGASMYMAYYDDNTVNKNIIFRTFKIGTDNTWVNTLSNGFSNLPERNTNGRISVAVDASKYLDLGVTPGNIVVIVYYNMTNGELRLTYSNGPIDGTDITPNQTWTTTPLGTFPSYVGPDVSMVIDSTGGIHISAYDTGDSDLMYMYLPAYNSTDLKVFRVDQAFSVGNWTKIKVKEDAGSKIPYIAYYNSSETGSRDSIKIAYANYSVDHADFDTNIDGDGYVLGTWEYMTVPAITPPQGGDSKFKQVNLDFNSSGKPIVGYLGTNLEFGNWLDE